MSVEAGLYQLLKSDSGVSSRISGRLFGGRAPKGVTFPCAVWNVAATQDVYSIQGASGLRFKRMQFDSYGEKYMETLAVSDAIRDALKSFRGTLPNDVEVQGCVVITDQDFPYEPGASGQIFRRMIEVEVAYIEQ